MIPLNMEVWFDYMDVNTCNGYSVAADKAISTTLVAAISRQFELGDHNDGYNNIFMSFDDYLDFYSADDMSYFVYNTNYKLGNIYEAGEIIRVEQDTYNALNLKQDAHANLDAMSNLTLASGKMQYATGATSLGQFDSTTYGRGLLNTADQAALQTAAGMLAPDWNASSGFSAIANKPTIPTNNNQLSNGAGYLTASAIARTTSTLSLSLVGSGATGTQISATKDSSVKLNVSTSTTSTIGGPSTSAVALKICSTNNATEGSWTTVVILENDQTITLAIVLNSIQVMKGQLCAEVPAGWYVKLVNSGSGTHTESFLSGQQTVFG